MRIFISYSSKDGLAYAKKLSGVLVKRGHDPYLADHGCVSEIIWDEIAEEIRKREPSIFVITESSHESKGQREEYGLVVAKHWGRMWLESEKASEMKVLDTVFPFLLPYRGLVFNDGNLEEKCETVSAQLLRLQDKQSLAQKTEVDRKEETFPKLMVQDLDESELSKCTTNLSESYQMETIVPEAFNVHEVNESKGLWNIGFNYRLPREWFLSYDETHAIYSNEFMFRQFGRSIALGERHHLVSQIMSNKDVSHVEGKDSSIECLLEKLNEAISMISANGFKPKTIFPTHDHRKNMHRFPQGGKIYLKYSDITPRPVLDSSLIIDGVELRLITPLGKIPKATIVFGNGAVRWHMKRYPKYGSLFIDIGNDRLFPKKYVQVLAFTTMKCEIDPKGIAVIETKSEVADKKETS
jgi:hypothetical protein